MDSVEKVLIVAAFHSIFGSRTSEKPTLNLCSIITLMTSSSFIIVIVVFNVLLKEISGYGSTIVPPLKINTASLMKDGFNFWFFLASV